MDNTAYTNLPRQWGKDHFSAPRGALVKRKDSRCRWSPGPRLCLALWRCREGRPPHPPAPAPSTHTIHKREMGYPGFKAEVSKCRWAELDDRMIERESRIMTGWPRRERNHVFRTKATVGAVGPKLAQRPRAARGRVKVAPAPILTDRVVSPAAGIRANLEGGCSHEIERGLCGCLRWTDLASR